MWPWRRRAEDLAFVLVAEAGVLERQALWLCASIRRFAGRYAGCPITVVSPRPERRPAPATLAALARLGCAYRALEVRSVEPDYGTTFRLYASAAIEAESRAEVLAVLDSDLLFCAEPDLRLGDADAAARPVDVQGICSSGPEDPRESYWRALAGLCGLDLACLPWVETTVDRRRVRASYNGGLVVARRAAGIFARTLDYFERSAAAGLAPSPGTAMVYHTGHGAVRGRGSELWGSAQACLSLAVWGSGHALRTLPPTHNVPLHSFAALSAEARARPLVIGHYHGLFEGAAADNPLLNGAARLPPAVARWIATRCIATQAGEPG